MSFDFKLQPNFILLEEFDETIIDSAIQKCVEKKAEVLEMHIIYAGSYYDVQGQTFKSFVSLEKHDLRSAIITQICMLRFFLITKEKMEEICLGKSDWGGYQPGILPKESVNDDLESVFEKFQHGRELEQFADTYFLPKLTHEELELVEKTDQDYFRSFYRFKNPDVKDEEMKSSESNSKYVFGYCGRWTYRVDKPTFQVPNTSIGSKNSIVSASNVSFSNLDDEDVGDESQHQNCN